jgi:hypothetical protein
VVDWKNADEASQVGWDTEATYRKKGDTVVLDTCKVKIHGSHPDLPDAMLSLQFEGSNIKTIQFIGNLNQSENGNISSRLPFTDEQKELLSAVGSSGLVYQDVDGGIDRLTLTLPTRLDDVDGPIDLVFEEEHYSISQLHDLLRVSFLLKVLKTYPTQ